MEEISFSDFQKVDIKIGKVTKAEAVEESDKLIRINVDFGEFGEKIVFSGIRKWYKPEDLEGNKFVFVCNLTPRKMMDEKSQAMMLGVEDGEDYVLLVPEKDVAPGTKVY